MRASVVVPVWNPGPNFQRCIDSLLAQSLPREDYEIVLVDDGSTDGTAERLDHVAAQHPEHVRVLHIPGSGWPGRPRNVGIDAARGEFVHLVDNDDTLPPYALERMVAAGVETEADVVMGRPASDFRGLVHSIYRTPVWTGSLREFPELTTTLTPHKMFRRTLLDEHGIRFPEGKVPLEDQMFVMAAYLHARRITVLSDRIYYSYLRRVGSGRNAGDSPIDALRQSQAVEQVLDTVEDILGDEPDADFRDRLLRRFYRINLLPRLTDEGIMAGDAAERDQVIDEVRRVTVARFGPGVTETVGAAHRSVGRLLRDGNTPALVALGAEFRGIGLRLEARELHWRDGALEFELDGGVTLHGELLRCERTDTGWAIPSAMAPDVPVADREFDEVRDEGDLELSLLSRVTSASFATESDLHFVIDDGLLRVRGRACIDPARALAGRSIDDGIWDLRGRMRFAGWNRACSVQVPGAADPPTPAAPPFVTADGRPVVAFLTSAGGPLTLDVGQWSMSLPAAVAPAARLTVDGADALVLHVDAVVAAATPPEVEVLLEPANPGHADVVALAGLLTAAEDGSAVARLSLPGSLAPGSWRPWLRVRADVAVPERLPWTVRVSPARQLTTAPDRS